jgi:hypothetical protein
VTVWTAVSTGPVTGAVKSWTSVVTCCTVRTCCSADCGGCSTSADAEAVESHQARAVPAATPPMTVNVRRTTRRANAGVCRTLFFA